MNCVRNKSWAGYTVTARVPYILKELCISFQNKTYIAQVSFHMVSVSRWIVEAKKDTH